MEPEKDILLLEELKSLIREEDTGTGRECVTDDRPKYLLTSRLADGVTVI